MVEVPIEAVETTAEVIAETRVDSTEIVVLVPVDLDPSLHRQQSVAIEGGV